MNLYIIDENPVECAIALDDMSIKASITPLIQLLSNIMHVYMLKQAPKRFITANGRIFRWTMLTSSNFNWVVSYLEALMLEYEYRFGTRHKDESLLTVFNDAITELPKGELTTFINNSAYPYYDNTFQAFKKTLANKWFYDLESPTWTKREKPEWSKKL